jgi:hypothetical protein
MGATRPKVKIKGALEEPMEKELRRNLMVYYFFDDLSKGFVGVSLFIQQPLKQ